MFSRRNKPKHLKPKLLKRELINWTGLFLKTIYSSVLQVDSKLPRLCGFGIQIGLEAVAQVKLFSQLDFINKHF